MDTPDLKSRIRLLSTELFAEVVRHRRYLHQNPELSFEEEQTAAYVAGRLDEMGIPYQKGIGGHGLVAHIRGRNPDRALVALRADMDALPIQEENEVEYRSKRPGMMHACGHDAHTASLLGVAGILTRLTDAFEGTVRLIFQPAEERLPGGASLMIRDGVLQNPVPSAVVGQHVMPLIPAGKVGFRSGMYMASADELKLVFRGRGGHAAQPHQNIDPIMACAQTLVALQQVVSRHAHPATPTVLSFGRVQADGTYNVIPSEVEVLGTFRTLDESWRYRAHELIKQIAEGTAAALGAQCEVHINVGYPCLNNQPELTSRLKGAACSYLGEEHVVDLDLWMAAEDFAYYGQHANACFYRLGTRNEEKGITAAVHTPRFDIDETALTTGAGLMSWLALQELAFAVENTEAS
ncbi:MAG: amidohydrolase [Bacteroidetes bacterium]|jgi:amidohydrolase|nr:amidohydrolase [Bacteroidota bacterium]